MRKVAARGTCLMRQVRALHPEMFKFCNGGSPLERSSMSSAIAPEW